MNETSQDEDMILLGMVCTTNARSLSWWLTERQLCDVQARGCPVKDHQEITLQPTGILESNLRSLKAAIGQHSGTLVSDCGKRLAYLNNKTHMALREVSSNHNISCTALIKGDVLEGHLTAVNNALGQKSRSASGIVPFTFDLLVFSPKHLADLVARTLAKYMLFLQHPHPYTYTEAYENPQYLDIPGASFSAGSILPPLNKDLVDAYESAEAQQVKKGSKQDVLDPSSILDDLPIPKGIHAIDIDSRIKAKLLE